MSTLKKAVQVLHVVAARGSVTPKELADVLRLSKSTAYRLILSMADLHLLERSGEGFVLGSLISNLAGGALKTEQLLRAARPHMAALRDLCGETVGLNVLQAGQRIVVGQEESRHDHCWVFKNVNVPRPPHAGASSKMLLAQLPRGIAEALLKSSDLPLLTPNTPVNRKSLLKELQRVSAQGYALSLQEVEPGIATVAVPIGVDLGGDIPAALSVTGPVQRLSEPVMKALVPELRAAADRIAHDMRARSQLPARGQSAALPCPSASAVAELEKAAS
jgi:DNA-binding IclR family transcriptional regulator